SHYSYAVLLAEALNNPEKAAKHFKKTLKHQGDHPFASYDLALYYHQEGKYKKAQKYYHRAIAVNPELQTPQNDSAFIIPEIPKETIAATVVQEKEETPQRPQLTDTVLITGATSGIGRASAFEFAQKGYQLVLTGRRADRLESLKGELQASYGIGVTLLQFDVRDQEACQTAFDQLNDLQIEIDILVNNAGLAMGLDPIHKGDIFHWETMIDTNIKGLLYMTRLISPGMVARQKGHIINVCSTAGKEVYPNGNVYCATKHAVDALTRAMRLDLAAYNIRVSQVAPAMVEETEFAVVRFEGNEERAKIYEDFQPLKAKDVAETIAFIATRPAYVNIQDVVMLGTQQASSTQVHRTGR
ncbi:MAG: SDR family NAD(P)-dependent oxidoreductase, partial [Bacteroidota bacterium]